MKRIIGIMTLLFVVSFASAGAGKHVGELKNLNIKVVYTNPMSYDAQGRAVYYIGGAMSYEVHLINMSPRTFQHLDITAVQEYHESGTCDRWWYPHPRTVSYSKGQQMPGDSKDVWRGVTLRGNETKVLQGGYTVPLRTCDGLDQTHVVIKHSNKGRTEAAEFFDDVIGVYCPPPPK